MRQYPERLTIAYMAIGAKQALAENENRYTPPESELEFIDEVVQHALMLDRFADEVDNAGGFTGCFMYEVAEPFGFELAQRAIHGHELLAVELAKKLVEGAA